MIIQNIPGPITRINDIFKAYMKSAWPVISDSRHHARFEQNGVDAGMGTPGSTPQIYD